ncbi:fimbrin [Tritrichomonas foetus]|uniref:Fimbrin n=1 Tax=Tritrichomonas foetus TaxID=1144522 RepID=A0A1J4K3B1_9EUKA|nr:fimbrin [Tritrichomonas foetus]|eukprot:OHT05466.1 fimbrin [Tritrichomonas foetus]
MSLNPNEYIPKFPQLTPDDIRMHAEHFKALDKDNSGQLTSNEVYNLFKEAQIAITESECKSLINEVDTDNDGKINFGEFLTLFVKELESGKATKLSEGLRRHASHVKVSGARGERTYPQEEVTGFVNYINSMLEGDPDLAHIMPIDPSGDAFFGACHDGILLCKLCNIARPDTVDERVITKKAKLNAFNLLENCTLAINSARSIGMQVINIGPPDIRDGTCHLILGLTWQLIRESLIKDIQLASHPELFRLLKEGETLEQLLKLSPEEILLRWLNYHLNRAGSSRTATNFMKDLSDSEILTVVMKQIAPECCTLNPMNESDLTQRAELMLQESDKIGCRKFVTPVQIVKGHPKLNLAFVANLFNTRPGLEALSEAELAQLDEALFAAAGTRLERQFCLWMNSYGVDPFVQNLYDGIQDGLVLLQMLDKIEPGCVDWSKVNKTRMNKFKAVQNNDLAVQIAHDRLGCVVVGTSGNDIYDGNKKLTAGLLWQIMRYDYLKTFKKLGGGAKIKDDQIVAWANGKTSGKVSIKNFKDPIISNSVPILNVIDVCKPQTVDWSIVDQSEDEALKLRNAKYVLSMVRKFGAAVYALPEDIVEVVPEMVMTVYASLMALP